MLLCNVSNPFPFCLRILRTTISIINYYRSRRNGNRQNGKEDQMGVQNGIVDKTGIDKKGVDEIGPIQPPSNKVLM